MTKKTILVLYYTRWVYPLRDTIEKHLYAWRRYSQHRILYVNVMFGFPEKLLRRIKIDAVVFHTIFLGMRWTPSIFKTYTEKCAYLKKLNCLKIAMPQDEFMQTDLLNDFINDFGVTHLLTCADERDWPFIYDKIDRNKISLKTVLTGYLDGETVRRINKRKTKTKSRDIDIGYRAWKAEYWLGEHGTHKARIADIFNRAAWENGLKVDISTREEDVLAGNDWFDYLLRCKTTIGVEGGASVLDKDGSIKIKVDNYLQEHPSATFEETRMHCFAQEDHKLGLACISPRHLEACATETCQLLLEGNYNGILRPWKHYLPIKKDYSNIKEILGLIKDNDRINRMTKTAYEDIVRAGRWTYLQMVKDLENTIINKTDAAAARRKIFKPTDFLVFILLEIKDRLDWQRIELEVMLKTKARRFRDRLWCLICKGIKKITANFYEAINNILTK